MVAGRSVARHDPNVDGLGGAQKELGALPTGDMGLQPGAFRRDAGTFGRHVITLGNALAGRFKGLLDDGMLGNAAVMLVHGASERRHGRSAVDPSHAGTAETVLKQCPQIAREDVAFDERVAEIGDADGAVECLDMGQLRVEMVHASASAARKVENGFHILGPNLLERDLPAVAHDSYDGLGGLWSRHHFHVFLINVG